MTELTKRATRFLGDASDSSGEPPTLENSPTPETPPPSATRTRRRKDGAARGSGRPPAPSGPSSTVDTDQPPAVVPDPIPDAVPSAPEVPPAPARSPLPDDLPFYLRNQIEHLSRRPLRETVEHLILALTEERGWLEPAQLAAWLGMTVPHLSRRYLGPMTEAGQLVRRYPNRPTHPEQAYRSAIAGSTPRR